MTGFFTWSAVRSGGGLGAARPTVNGKIWCRSGSGRRDAVPYGLGQEARRGTGKKISRGGQSCPPLWGMLYSPDDNALVIYGQGELAPMAGELGDPGGKLCVKIRVRGQAQEGGARA